MLQAFVVTTTLLLGGLQNSPNAWSPDGRWLAYTVEVRAINQVIKPGWIFGEPGSRSPSVPSSTPRAYRLWATRADSGVSTLLEESSFPITGPCWSPEGRSLAFGRVVPEAAGKARFEVIILDTPGRSRVIASGPIADSPEKWGKLTSQAISWSADGRYLAIPRFNPRGLEIVRSENGRHEVSIKDGLLPSWAPDGSRIAFYVRETSDTLYCLDSLKGTPRALTEVGLASQAPVWTRDGQNVIVVARKPAQGGFDLDGEAQQAEMLRVRLDTGESDKMFAPLTVELGRGKDRGSEGVSIALDRSGENLFAAVAVDGQPCPVIWYQPRDGSVYSRFPVLDFSQPVSSLSVSPDARTLSARVGRADRLTSPALCLLDSNDPKTRPIVTDDDSRVVWIATAVDAAKAILANLPVASTDPSHPASTRVERPNLLPILGEIDLTSEMGLRLHRIGRIGRSFCDRPSDAPAPEPALSAILDEARLFFDYLREDYLAALGSLEVMEAHAETPERRLALMGIRAQIFLNRTELDRAKKTIDYLQELEGRPIRQVEETANGYRLTEIPDSTRGWPRYLALRASTIRTLIFEGDPEHRGIRPDFRPAFRLEPFGNGPNPFFPQDRPFPQAPPNPDRRIGPMMPNLPVPRIDQEPGPRL